MPEKKVCEKSILESRIRQLLAADKNATDVYLKLANLFETEEMKNQMQRIAAEEQGHVALCKKMLDLLKD